MRESYGQTTTTGEAEVSKDQENSQLDDRAGSLGTARREGEINGVNSIRLGGDVGNGGEETRSIGGILRQLKRAKESYLEYVNAHSERLRLRLAEDEAQRKQLLDDIARLEREISEIEESESKEDE